MLIPQQHNIRLLNTPGYVKRPGFSIKIDKKVKQC